MNEMSEGARFSPQAAPPPKEKKKKKTKTRQSCIHGPGHRRPSCQNTTVEPRRQDNQVSIGLMASTIMLLVSRLGMYWGNSKWGGGSPGWQVRGRKIAAVV